MSPTAAAPGRAGGASADLLSLYLQLAPLKFFLQVRQQKQLRRQNNRIYTDAVVIWLMILQRLSGASMELAVLELLCTLPPEFWPRPCKRLKTKRGESKLGLSSHAGSYNEARQQLPLPLVEECSDRAFLQLIDQFARPAMGNRDAFFLDGSTMRMPDSAELRAHYPPTGNQNGKSHWPLLRIIVAHDLYTGLAMRPQWGPVNGDNAVSEQSLLEQAIDRLPRGSILLGDANFGVFSVAYAATQRGHPVVLRLTLQRTQPMAKQPLRDGIDLRFCWRPSRHDRESHPELPADACVEGRLIVREVEPSGGKAPFLLALFTTLEDEAGSVIEFYGLRWNIELDLRSLKSTLQLEQLSSTTPEMVAKEIDVGMLAYNLVRAVTCMAAQKAGLKPRQFSFTRVRNVINVYAPRIVTASSQRRAQLLEEMMYYVNQAKLPRRKKRRSYPRAVWHKPEKYPRRH